MTDIEKLLNLEARVKDFVTDQKRNGISLFKWREKMNIHKESLISVGKFLVLQIYEEAFDQALTLPTDFAMKSSQFLKFVIATRNRSYIEIGQIGSMDDFSLIVHVLSKKLPFC